MTAEELAQYPVKGIQDLVDRAYDFASPNVVMLLRVQLFSLPDPQQRTLAAAIDSLLLENRKQREELALLQLEIKALKNPELVGGLGDK